VISEVDFGELPRLSGCKNAHFGKVDVTLLCGFARDALLKTVRIALVS